MRLSEEQIKEFDDKGFLLLPGFAKGQLCEDIVQKAKEHMQAMEEPYESEQSYLGIDGKPVLRRLRQVYDRDEVFAKWMRERKIRPVLRQLLGQSPVLVTAHHNSIMTKMPSRTSRTEWHQDMRFWSYQNSDLISVWLALGQESRENGVLEFIPGSHTMELDPRRFDENKRFREDLAINQELIEKRVHYELKQGDVVLFHAKVLHAAGENKTFEPKLSFVYTVRALSNKPLPKTRSAEYKEFILE
ncbi:MAG: phytanoyl-CoA dioxygenase family protein, partial [Campylobacterota bacterium]